MIRYITFPELGRYGYIYKKLERPEKPKKPGNSCQGSTRKS